MKNCKKCNKEFEPTKGLINYCSLECRNSRVWSDEDKLKKSESAKNSEKVKESSKKYSETIKMRTPEIWKIINEKREEALKNKIIETNYGELSFERLRKRIIYEQDSKCNRCDLSEWMGEKIPLELEHKDGNHFNNDRDNLEILCPNCHALTSTWRGRNKNTVRNINDDEKLLEALLMNEWNMRKALISLNMSPKGGNYKRCHKLMKEYNENIKRDVD